MHKNKPQANQLPSWFTNIKLVAGDTSSKEKE